MVRASSPSPPSSPVAPAISAVFDPAALHPLVGLLLAFALLVRTLGGAVAGLPWCCFWPSSRSHDPDHVLLVPLWLIGAVAAREGGLLAAAAHRPALPRPAAGGGPARRRNPPLVWAPREPGAHRRGVPAPRDGPGVRNRRGPPAAAAAGQRPACGPGRRRCRLGRRRGRSTNRSREPGGAAVRADGRRPYRRSALVGAQRATVSRGAGAAARYTVAAPQVAVPQLRRLPALAARTSAPPHAP